MKKRRTTMKMNKTVAIVMLAATHAVQLIAADADIELGGVITIWPKDPGRFLFVNAQKRVPRAAIETPIKRLYSDFAVNIVMVDGAAPDIRTVPASLSGLGAKGAIWIVDDPVLPVSLVAPENGWGILNVAPLLADGPDPAKLGKRIAKFIYRTFANVNGIGDSTMMPACVMKQAVGIEGVDNLVCATYSPEACTKIASFLAMAGYKRCNVGTYYDACEEGWAPLPTNDVQKAIWDKVHQLPTKPLTIRRESERKGK